MSKRRRFKRRIEVTNEYVYPKTEEVTTRERQADSIVRIQCPQCKGELYFGQEFFIRSGVKPDPESLNLVVLHCLQCQQVCKVEMLEQRGKQ